MGTGENAPFEQKGRHSGDTHLSGSLPVPVDFFSESGGFQDLSDLHRVEINPGGDILEHTDFREIAPFGEICPKRCIVKRVPPTLLFRPLAQFVCPPAVECHLAIAKGQTLLPGNLAESIQHGFNVDISSREQVL